MAEFKLGRIRFVWKGAWNDATSYLVDDVVSNGGQTYICVENHTSAALFATDLNENPSYWNLISGGITWKNEWDTNTYYDAGDIVRYGGIVYICTTAHTSAATTALGLEDDSGFWQEFAADLYWLGAWTTNTRYRKNDFVSYGGITYVCNAYHTSAATLSLGLEDDLELWDEFNAGITYLADWTDGDRYRENDVVKYGASTWICTTYHTATSTFDNSKWSLFVEGIEFENTWNGSNTYQIGDIVTYGGYSYVCKQNHSTSQTPSTATAYWDVYTTGFNFQGDWTATSYKVGDVVRVGGYTYVAKLDNNSQQPPNLTYWNQLNSGVNWTDVQGTYTTVTTSNVTVTNPSAAGVQYTVVRSGTIYTLTRTANGTNYTTGDIVKILGTNVGGATPANDITITLTASAGSVSSETYIGESVTWTTSTAYVQGDVVFWGANSYICISGHVSGTPSRPDNDTAGDYWNLLASGSEVKVLTTDGDTYYYGPNGPSRLPVGTDGQVLRVKDGYPTWAYYGLINNLVFVGPTGADTEEPGQGLTVDKPWASVRYACAQVEQGYLNRSATELLRRNKQFIMKEITNWITYTYTVNITSSDSGTYEFTLASGDTANLVSGMPIKFSGTTGGVTAGVTYYVKTVVDSTHFTISNIQGGVIRVLTAGTTDMTGSLAYDSMTCERDVGLIVDALVYDISHGGNEEVTTAAKAYYTPSGSAYINSNFGQQITQTVAAYNYLKSLIIEVIGNNEPNTIYQDENSVPSIDQALQEIDVTLIAEDGTDTLSTDLLTIITDGISGGTLAAIPAAVTSNTTINVKTGTYFEVLPIVVPKNTSVVGDELRGTVIRPQPAISSLVNDQAKTISALNRIKAIMPDLIDNAPVTPTTGNAETQIDTYPAGSLGNDLGTTRIISSAEIIYDILNNGITARPTELITDPGTLDTGYSRGRNLISGNYAFIKADVSKFLENDLTYGPIWTALGATGQAKCQRDIGYILDAIRYDMTYGGNTQTLIAGRSYYSSINLTIAETEKAATIGAYTFLQGIIDNIVLGTAISPQSGNTTPRGSTSPVGSAGAAAFAQARVQDVIDWITNGTSPTEIAPDTSWVDADLLIGFNAIQDKKSEIQSDGLVFVNKFYQDLSFNEELCSRDIGYMVDALSYDMAFGSNFASIVVGLSYHRGISSTNVVLADQKAASLGLITFLKYKLKGLAGGGSVTQIGSVIDDITGTITGGAVPRFLWPDYTGVDAEDFAAAKLIWENKSFIVAELSEYLSTTYSSVWTSILQTSCTRDIGYIVDALRYDLTYGGKSASKQAGVAYYSRLTSALEISSTEKTATLAAYAVLKSIVQDIAQGGTSYTALQVDVTRTTGTSGDATSSTRVGALVDVITNIITDGLTTGVPKITITTVAGGTTFTSGTHNLNVGDEVIPQTTPTSGNGGYGLVAGTIYYVASTPLTTTFTLAATYGGAAITTFTNGTGLSLDAEITNLPGTSWVDATLITQNTSLSTSKSTIQTNVINFINANYPNLVYNSTTCSRDVGYIIDALRYDLMMGSNFRSVKAGMSYYQAQASLVIGDQKRATLQAFRYLRGLVVTTVIANSEAVASVKNSMDIIINILDKGVGETPSVHGTMDYNNTLLDMNSVAILRANKTFLEHEATAWITQNYGGDVTTTTASSNLYTTSATHNLAIGDPVVFSGTVIGGSGILVGTTYYVLTVPSTTTFTLTATQGDTTPVDITSNGSGSMTVRYSFDAALCRRDMGEYIDSLIHDLQFTGNYRGTRAAELYVNAVKGSEMSDMFRIRNSCGLRNCTLNGLTGDLTAANDFGTKRPTAGAFVALDPGFGPNDENVWIKTRSHYSQNVTMFGVGCSGAKIDSALHNGGNKSMVKNDFTTIISDGIGVWCTGADSLTELVSVFNYYGYAGYLAEKGGRIRATNGNSSYGTYGVIAEGVSSKETPLYATIDNRYAQAQITNTVTDGVMEVLRFEFGNAGTNYSNALHTINGSGYNAAAIADEFRDAAIFETRIIDLDDDNGFGGTEYESAANAAQSGDAVSITIAATDTALSAAYVGMRIQIIAGTGVGQYANILTYETGSKVAKVIKDSFETLTVTATAITNDLLTVASTATLYPGKAIYLGSTANGVTANTLYYVMTANFSSTQFSVSLTGPSGTAVDITTTGSVSIPLYAAGWDHIVSGTIVEAALDLTTSYIIEPRISYTAPGYTATAITLNNNVTWKAVTYAAGHYVAVANGSTASNYSTDGTTWDSGGSLPSTADWIDIVYGGGYGATATATIGGQGGQGAILQAVFGVANTTGAATADQIASVTIVDGGVGYTTPPVIVFTPTSGGIGAVATCAVLNGKITNVTVTSPGSGYAALPTVAAATDRVTEVTVNTWGRQYYSDPTVTIADPFTGSAWSNGGTVAPGDYIYFVNVFSTKNWYYVSSGTTLGSSGPTHTSGSASNGTTSLLYAGTTATVSVSRDTDAGTIDGVVTLTVTDDGAGYTSVPLVSILDTNAKYVAISGSSNDNCYTTVAGITAGSAWTAGASTSKLDLKSIAYGNGIYVAVGGASSAVSSTTGTSWTSRTIPTLGSGSYISVAYGNETFVAISEGTSLSTAFSSNGTSWTAGGNLPAAFTGGAISIAYGNGRFVALAQEAGGTRNVAYSLNKGVTWILSEDQLPVNTSWSKVSYGQGLFVAIASQGSEVCATSPDGVTWTVQATPSLPAAPDQEWRDVVFGNPDNNPLWVIVANSDTGAIIRTGAQALGRVKVASGTVTEVRMIEPGSGYPKATITATTTSTNVITTNDTINLVDSQPVEFTGCATGGLEENVTYYVIGSTIVSNTSFKVSATAGSSTPVTLTTTTGLTGTYRAGPIVTVTDPNNVINVALRVRQGDGALGNPSFTDRGADNNTATSETLGDGYADLYQTSTFINVAGLYESPVAGANIEFASLPGEYFKLVAVTNVGGVLGNYTATFQINPGLTVLQAPSHGDAITTRLKYSQVRLTGHDFLYIGTGNFERTNYPNVDITNAIQANQSNSSGGGRVFFTSTDQDGNFNVGNLFGVQQATGTATLNASAFNLSGLNSLQLGALELGVDSAIITQFSTDPFFTADSDNIVPTQRAIRAYITAQIGGGQSSLNVNTLTSGVVYIAGDSIGTTTGVGLNVTSKMNFTGGIDGAPVALGFFMQR
jgi:hypothetical protein